MQRKSEQAAWQPIAYASRSLKTHEKNYSALLLELTAATFGIEQFHVYLYDTPFTLVCDHKPMEKLSTVHTRTLLRLQEKMNEYTFTIRYLKGEDNVVADALSRAPEVCELHQAAFRRQQQRDDLCKRVRADATAKNSGFSTDTRDGVLYKARRTGPDGYAVGNDKRIVVPENMRRDLMHAAHTHPTAGHGGVAKTMFRLNRYWWPNMDRDVRNFIKHCHTCQQIKNPTKMHRHREPIGRLPPPTGPNQRVHADLMLVKRPSTEGRRYILVMTDAFTKHVELVALKTKEAQAVARAIFDRWICRFSCFEQLVTDQGREFCNQVLDALCRHMGIRKTRTSAFHPQSNGQCETFNRTCWKLLAAYLEDPDSPEWEQYLPLVMLAYNTSLHQAIKTSPFFLTHHHHPTLPHFDMSSPAPIYAETWASDLAAQARRIRAQAHAHLQQAQRQQEHWYNEGTKHTDFQVNDAVWVKFPRSSFSARNAKLVRTWRPFRITRVISGTTYEARRDDGGPLGRKTTVHRNRLKARLGLEQPFEESEDELQEKDGDETFPANDRSQTTRATSTTQTRKFGYKNDRLRRHDHSEHDDVDQSRPAPTSTPRQTSTPTRRPTPTKEDDEHSSYGSEILDWFEEDPDESVASPNSDSAEGAAPHTGAADDDSAAAPHATPPAAHNSTTDTTPASASEHHQPHTAQHHNHANPSPSERFDEFLRQHPDVVQRHEDHRTRNARPGARGDNRLRVPVVHRAVSTGERRPERTQSPERQQTPHLTGPAGSGSPPRRPGPAGTRPPGSAAGGAPHRTAQTRSKGPVRNIPLHEFPPERKQRQQKPPAP